MNASKLARMALLLAVQFLSNYAFAQSTGPLPKIRRATRQTQFHIPFSLDRAPTDVAEVRLFMSLDRGRTWQVADVRRAHAKTFLFHAPADGAYWFASRTVDAAQRLWPSDPLAPELEVIVDTTQPQLDVETKPSGVVSWSAWDPLLSAKGLQVEMLSSGAWKPIPAASQRANGRWEGSVQVPADATEVRVVAIDQAGNRAVLSRALKAVASGDAGGRKFLRGGQKLGLPTGIPNDPMQKIASTSPTTNSLHANNPATKTPATTEARSENLWKPRSEAYAATRERWPALNQGGRTPQPSTSQPQTAPTPKSPWDVPPPAYVAKPPSRSASDSTAAKTPQFSPASANATQTTPTDDYAPVPGAVGPTFAEQQPAAGQAAKAPATKEPTTDSPLQVMPGTVTKTTAPGFSKVPTGPTTDDAGTLPHVLPQWSNRMRFSMDYQLDAILSKHVGEVELWATADGGETWSRWGTDPDKQSPVSVKIDSEGVYGFDVVVVSERGMASSRPRKAADADVWIGVDITPPVANWADLIPGEGEHEGHLDMRWTLKDENLANLPVSISYSSSPSGPWTSIASDMENSGRYLWLPTPAVPEKIYMQLKAVDLAGNVTEVVTPEPFVLYGLRPRANIRAVLPK